MANTTRCVRLVTGVVLAAFAVTSCASPPPSPVVSQTTDGTYQLVLSVGPGALGAAEAIDVRATLTYVGSEGSVVVTGIDTGLVWVSFEQVDGPLSMAPGSRLMCSEPVTLRRNEPVTFRPVKGAGWATGDPNAAFYQHWMADPVIHLPAGHWRIVAQARVYDGTTCDKPAPDHDLTAPPLVVDVAA